MLYTHVRDLKHSLINILLLSFYTDVYYNNIILSYYKHDHIIILYTYRYVPRIIRSQINYIILIL